MFLEEDVAVVLCERAQAVSKRFGLSESRVNEDWRMRRMLLVALQGLGQTRLLLKKNTG